MSEPLYIVPTPLGTVHAQLGRIVLGLGALVVPDLSGQALWEPVWLVEISTP